MANRKQAKPIQQSPYRPKSKKRQNTPVEKVVDQEVKMASKGASWILVISLIIGIGGPAVVSVINMSGSIPSVNPPSLFAPWWVALIGLGIVIIGIVNFCLFSNSRSTS